MDSPPGSYGTDLSEVSHVKLSSKVLYTFQLFIIFIVVLAALLNITFDNGDQKFWVSLLSLCIGYTIPNPKLKLSTPFKAHSTI